MIIISITIWLYRHGQKWCIIDWLHWSATYRLSNCFFCYFLASFLALLFFTYALLLSYFDIFCFDFLWWFVRLLNDRIQYLTLILCHYYRLWLHCPCSSSHHTLCDVILICLCWCFYNAFFVTTNFSSLFDFVLTWSDFQSHC